MEFMTEKMLPVKEIADSLGITEEHLNCYGKYTAKLSLALLEAPPGPPRGKLVLVTAITPTSRGEGKTVVSIGLAQAIARRGPCAWPRRRRRSRTTPRCATCRPAGR